MIFLSVITEKSDVTISYLLIQRARSSDSGTYTCSPSNASSKSVNVHITAGEVDFISFKLKFNPFHRQQSRSDARRWNEKQICKFFMSLNHHHRRASFLRKKIHRKISQLDIIVCTLSYMHKTVRKLIVIKFNYLLKRQWLFN